MLIQDCIGTLGRNLHFVEFRASGLWGMRLGLEFRV